MTKRMLIDATHAEETRVVVLDGSRLEDFDVETSAKRQLKGNIYLAKVVRVEPSLQAAFVEYGGNRHGFLAFGEIHPDYYQIPVADRQRLIEQEAEEARREEEEEDRAAAAAERTGRREPSRPKRQADETAEPEFGAPADTGRGVGRISGGTAGGYRRRGGRGTGRGLGTRRRGRIGRGGSRPRHPGAIEATFEEVERPADAVAEDDDEAVFARRAGSPSTRRRRPWAARATAPRSRASAASRRASCATTRSRR